MNSEIQKLHQSIPYRKNKTGMQLNSVMRKKLRMVVIFSIMMAVFTLSFLPFAVGRLLFDAGILQLLSPMNHFKLWSLCHIVNKSCAVINPLLTLLLKEHYHNWIKRLFKKIFYDVVGSDDEVEL